jgi:two-component system, OmpR family, sensor kinase
MLGRIEAAFRAREESEAAAKVSEERMRRFVADASHELRTPLTSIRGFAELYRQGAVPNPQDITRVMRRIEDQATRMGLLVEDLLMLARLDQQRPLDLEPVDLLTIASEAVQDARALDPGRPVALAMDDDRPPPVVLGDETRLRQVVGNLMSNAMTHTDPGTPITVSVRTDGAFGALDVADRGPGMAEHDAAHVFERFYRADSSRARTSGGTGLGLSIAAALVATHSGTLTVQTAPGEGATFSLRVPLVPAAPDPDGTSAEDDAAEMSDDLSEELGEISDDPLRHVGDRPA